jgi:hypothetical protein
LKVDQDDRDTIRVEVEHLVDAPHLVGSIHNRHGATRTDPTQTGTSTRTLPGPRTSRHERTQD